MRNINISISDLEFRTFGIKKDNIRWEKRTDQKNAQNLRKNGRGNNKGKKALSSTLRLEIDEEAFENIYGYRSRPIKIVEQDQFVAIRVVGYYGEEVMKVIKIS